MGEALKDAYHDLFLIKAHPTTSDRKAIEGKFKSFHNTSDNVAQLMAKTFFALLSLADINSEPAKHTDAQPQINEVESDSSRPSNGAVQMPSSLAGFHYNIQIHLPATKDVEVYNAIFKSLKEHFVE